MASIERHKVEATLRHYLDHVATNKGETVGVHFIKKDGTFRSMSCRFGVKKHLKGGVRSWSRKDYPHLMTVFDMNAKSRDRDTKGDYRTINLDTVKFVTMGGNHYDVV